MTTVTSTTSLSDSSVSSPKAASRDELADFAVASARNAQHLLDDAELLAASDSDGRGYSLASLALEGSGKSAELAALAVMPPNLRQQAPLRRMLEWHQLKLVGGLLLTALPCGRVAARIAAMTRDEVAGCLRVLAPANQVDRLKRRGLYVDMEAGGRISTPSQITAAEAGAQLGRARAANKSVGTALLVPNFWAWLADTPPDDVDLAEALVSALIEKKGASQAPDAAIEVVVQAVTKYRARRAI